MTRLISFGAMALAALAAAGTANAQDDVAKVLQELREQARQQPARVDLQLSLGNAAVRTENYDEAISAFRVALASLDPESPEAGDVHLRIGESARRKGDLETAAAALRRASALLPDNPVVPGTLALVLDLAGKFPEAEATYRAVLKLDPENTITMNNLGYLLAMHGGNLDEALSFARAAHQAEPDTLDYSDTLAVVYTRRGELAAALPILVYLTDRDPLNEGFRHHLATALEQKSGRSDAEQQLLGALKAAPSPENQQQVAELLKAVR
jgi:Flp pilus assembly protein TadD